jgi:hypothetical protein
MQYVEGQIRLAFTVSHLFDGSSSVSKENMSQMTAVQLLNTMFIHHSSLMVS